MIGTLNRKEIGKGAFLNSVTEPKFKHNRITLCLVTPLEREKATVNALVPFVLRKGCRSCPDFTALNKKLAEMYGAILEADVGKHKNKQIIEITLLMADDKYAIGGEKMTETAANLLWDIVFEPNLDENGFFSESFFYLRKAFALFLGGRNKLGINSVAIENHRAERRKHLNGGRFSRSASSA